MRVQDLVVLIGVILIILMMIIPIPIFLLDILIIVNISVAILILLVAMNTVDALHFSIFPTLLLITTLFRLSLNISTTRIILTTGEGGSVVETFGKFVAGGNLVVGFVIFLILVIVQFIVITKGAERVAEVAARFTLDAMPGKQMSIDADLNAGIINELEAKERREKISKESDFYGAMDGGSKFVKGDAIAGIIIVLINLVGGLIIGMVMMDMSFSKSMSTFAILTIGDGLVSMIPALLISTATGIIVTRAASEGNLAFDLSSQLFRYPKLMYIVAGAILGLGLFTPIHLLPSLGVSSALAFAGFQMQRNLNKMQLEESKQEEEQEIEEVRSPESVVSLLQIDAIEFEFGYGLIPLADAQQGGDLLDRVIMIRRQCAIEMGIIVPIIRIRDNVQLKPNEYVIKIKGDTVSGGELLLNNYLAMSPGFDDGDDQITGIETVEPAFGLPAIWIDETMKEQAEYAGYTVVDPPSVVATHLTEVIKRHSHELLGRQETKSLIDNIRESHPALIEELIPSLMTIGDIQKVLSKLLKEKVSIKNLVQILEALADNAPYTKDADMLTEYVRQNLSRQITLQYSNGEDNMKVVTLGPKLERKIAESIQQNEQGMYIAMDPATNQSFMQNLNDQIQRMIQMGYQPIVLCSPAVRLYVRQLLERSMADLPILSYNELDPSVEIQSVGVVNV